MIRSILAVVLILSLANIASADIFGTGANEFSIDFVNISGDASSANGTDIGIYKTFRDPSNDYRIGTYEITNDQFAKFAANTPSWTGTNVPANNVSWYEAAQFINWLNTSTGHQPAYKFTGTQGTPDYTFAVWESGDAGYDSTNPYRNSNAFYFLPTEEEWVKAAYWNGTSLQFIATRAGDTIYQGNGLNGGWNYWDDGDNGPDGLDEGPWAVGSGSEELNGTFDMMGNVYEWMESPWYSGDYLPESTRVGHGGAFNSNDTKLRLKSRGYIDVGDEYHSIGFRVAAIPEPATLLLIGLGGLFLRRRPPH